MEKLPFRTLPDYLTPGLNVVLVGINPGLYSVEKGHYFARRQSRFWPAFSASRLSEPVRRGLGIVQLLPEHDEVLPRFGIGLTDVVKRPTANSSGLTEQDFQEWVPKLLEKIRQYSPKVVSFHGVTGYAPFARIAFARTERVKLGAQAEPVGATRFYVVPNPSPANAHFNIETQRQWYDKLAQFIADG